MRGLEVTEANLRMYYAANNPSRLDDASFLPGIVAWGAQHPAELERRLVAQYGDACNWWSYEALPGQQIPVRLEDGSFLNMAAAANKGRNADTLAPQPAADSSSTSTSTSTSARAATPRRSSSSPLRR